MSQFWKSLVLTWPKLNFRRLCEYYATFFLIKSTLLGLATWFGFYSMPWGMDLPDFYSVTHMMQRTTRAEKHLSLFITMFFLWYLLDSFKSKQTFVNLMLYTDLERFFFPFYYNVVSCIYEFWWPWRVYFSPLAPIRNRLQENIVFMWDSLNVTKQTDVSKTCFS